MNAKRRLRVAVLLSGSGTSLENLFDPRTLLGASQ